jgi:hypothetical protein
MTSVEVRYLGFKILFVKQVVRLLVSEQYDGAWNTRGWKLREDVRYVALHPILFYYFTIYLFSYLFMYLLVYVFIYWHQVQEMGNYCV